MALLVDNPNWQSFASALESDRGLPAGLLAAIMRNESAGGHPDFLNATSSAGAQGAFQFIPSTAQQYHVNVGDTADSTRGAADYLHDLIRKYGDPLLAGAAYNWGPGKLDTAMKAAAGAGVPTDALSLANHGFLPKETAGYVAKLAGNLDQPASTGVTPFPPDVVQQTRGAVAQMYQQGLAPIAIVQQLSRSPVAPMIQALTAQGTSPDDIVTQVGGQPLAQVKAAQQQVANQGFLTNLSQGADSGVNDLTGGAQQLWARATGDDQGLQKLQQQAAADQADPYQQALGSSVGGMLGSGAVKAVPFAAASALAPEGVVAQALANALAGGASGALKPTTGADQLLSNIGTEAGLGALGAAGGAVVGKGLGKLGSMLGVSPQEAAEREALMQAAQRQGLPVTAANLSPTWRSVTQAMPNSGAVRGLEDSVDSALAGKVAEGLGVPNYSGPINHDLLNLAGPQIKADLDAATNVSVTLPQSFATDLQQLLAKASNPLTKGIADNTVVNQAAANLIDAANNGLSVSGRQLQALNSELKGLTQTQGASASERALAGQLVDKVNGVLKGAMTPDQQAAFAAANQRYANLKAVENMVRLSNDTGVVTPKQMLSAAKSGRFRNQFLSGDSPYQDLAGTASDLYGDTGQRGFGKLLGSLLGGHRDVLTTASVLEPTHGIPLQVAQGVARLLAGKLATSENPTVVRLLSGMTQGQQLAADPVMRAYLAKALAGSGAVAASQ